MKIPLPSNDRDSTNLGSTAALFWAEVLLVFCIWFMHAAWPVPEVNEAHYLGKAKHYWNPAWCANDFFLNTADAHQVFYWSVGWLTTIFSLPTVAWIGRVAAWLALAVGWVRMTRAMLAPWWLRVAAAALFITLMARCHLAGEWIIGGVEAKCFAFALGFLGIGALVQDRWNWAWVCFGAAAAFHVLAGGWLVVCGGMAWLLLRFGSPYRPHELGWPGLIIGGLISLAGLIPAILLTRGADPQVVAEANFIYVVERLPHHLLPQNWPPHFLWRFSGLIAGWLVLCLLTCRQPVVTAERRRLVAVVNAALVLSIVGIVIAWCQPWLQQSAWSLLRFYWFRTADILLPLGVAVAACWWVADLLARQSRWAIVPLLSVLAAGTWHLGDTLKSRGFNAIAPADRKLVDAADWQQTCRWIDENLPADVVFMTPRLAATFRWYANRAEVASWKDVPQDAASIVEWRQRLIDLHGRDRITGKLKFYPSQTEVPPNQLRAAARKYGAQYLITEANPPLPFPLVGPVGGAYAIYDLRDEVSP